MAFTVKLGFIDGSTRTYTCDVADYGNASGFIMVNAVLTNTTVATVIGVVLALLAVPPIPVNGQAIYGIEHAKLTSWSVLEQV